jgi:chemotaxis protein CheD
VIPRERVSVSEFRVATAPAVLVSYGLGSCLAIAIWDSERRQGGLAHTLLPSVRTVPGERPTKYVDAATRLMCAALQQQGSDIAHLSAKLAGGANMFALHNQDGSTGIGARNIATARAVLAEMGIKVAAEDVGGDFGRTVEFDVASGTLIVRAVSGRADKVL